ncbi:MAG: hypothetical protein LBR87_07665, partial [Synergistaceae bacterium]|nr:hypothetical protein [Synergistaceae bacterium]
MAAISGEFEGDGRELSQTARRLAVSLTLACAAFLAAYTAPRVFGVRFGSPWRFAAGLAAGWACSMVKVRMMTRSFFRMMRPDGGSIMTSLII